MKKILTLLFLTPTSMFCQLVYISIITLTCCLSTSNNELVKNELLAVVTGTIFYCIMKFIFTMNLNVSLGRFCLVIVITIVGILLLVTMVNLITGGHESSPGYVNIGVSLGMLIIPFNVFIFFRRDFKEIKKTVPQ